MWRKKKKEGYGIEFRRFCMERISEALGRGGVEGGRIVLLIH